MPPRSRPGFAAGFFSLVRAVGSLAKQPRLWGWALLPAVVFIVLLGLFGTLSLAWVRPWVLRLLPEASTTLGRWGASLVGWLGAVAAMIVGWFIAAALAPAISSPALAKIVAEVERELGAPPQPPLSFLNEQLCGLRAFAAATLFGIPILLGLGILQLLVPPVVVVTMPLQLVVSALLVAWGLLDYPLTLRGVGVRRRLRLLRDNLGAALGFGAACAALFWIPCCSILALPIAVAGATRLLWMFSNDAPSQLAGVAKRGP